jgi:preprotein translocase subunit SecG
MNFIIFILVTFYILASLFLIFIILIQSGKGGGLSSLGSASQGISDTFGTTGAERTLNKLTTYSAVMFVVLAILISLAIGHQSRQKESILGDEGAAPAAPVSPAAGQPPVAAPPAGVDLGEGVIPPDQIPSDLPQALPESESP